jgi:hypothetical protein
MCAGVDTDAEAIHQLAAEPSGDTRAQHADHQESAGECLVELFSHRLKFLAIRAEHDRECGAVVTFGW